MSGYDVVIVGGGPAGLSAATILGRCCRKVLVVDAGDPRNARSEGVHGFLTRDGILPAELLKLAREQLAAYAVETREDTVMSAERTASGFHVSLLSGATVTGRKVLLATGVVDKLPDIEGMDALYGRSIHHCPYCDGWEHRDEPIAVYGKTRGGVGLALVMKTWSRDVLLLTDGPARLTSAEKEKLIRFEVPIEERKVTRFNGTAGNLEEIEFETGPPVRRCAVFLSTGTAQRSRLVRELGCECNPKGAVKVDRAQRTSVSGVFVAGDACQDAQFAIIAAAHGARAAMAINQELQEESGQVAPPREEQLTPGETTTS